LHQQRQPVGHIGLRVAGRAIRFVCDFVAALLMQHQRIVSLRARRSADDRAQWDPHADFRAAPAVALLLLRVHDARCNVIAIATKATSRGGATL
jgi:hypothetical protein